MFSQPTAASPNPAIPPFEQIVRDHQAMVFRTLARLTGPCRLRDDILRDLAQDVFLRLYRALPTFRGEALLTTYLYRTTINVAQDELKRRRRAEFDPRRHISLSAPLSSSTPGPDQDWESRLPHPGSNPAQLLEEHEFAHALEQHLNQLSQVERTVLILYHQEERTYEQIAHIMAMPIGTIRTHLHRSRQKLRVAIASHQGAHHAH